MPGGFRAAAQSLAFLPLQLPCSDHGGSSYSLSARCNVKLGRALAGAARGASQLDVGTPVGQELPAGRTLLQLTQIQLCIEDGFLTDGCLGDYTTKRIGNK